MFLAVDKPQGITSFDVIRRLKRQFPKKTKIGHSGTLDPMATGLLIIAVDKDTKRLHEFLGADKSYETTIDFSKMSDTWDMDYWEVYEEYPVRHCEEQGDEAIQEENHVIVNGANNKESTFCHCEEQGDEAIQGENHVIVNGATNKESTLCHCEEGNDEAIQNITNNRLPRPSGSQGRGIIKHNTFIPAPTIEQIKEKLTTLIPSAILPLTPFSAKKKDGKKLYELARAGIEVNESREMRVNSYEIVDYSFPTLTLKLDVGSGTYIRSIGYRLGQEFGLGGILTSLRRTKVADIDIRTLTLDQEVEGVRYEEITL